MDTIKLDKWDLLIASGSGALTAALDVLLIKDISLKDAHADGSKWAENLVIKVAKSKKFMGKDDDLPGAVKHLENQYPIPADLLTNDFGGGSYHHLRDFSHHPTIVGLMFSIISQFTGNGYGTDTAGNFKKYSMTEKGFHKLGLVDSIYTGTIAWLFHMLSDVCGSSGTVRQGKEGTGIPGPIMALLKELSSVPGIKKIAGQNVQGVVPSEKYYDFSVMCTKLFQGRLLGEHDENGKFVRGTELPFDLRTEIGIVDQALANRQYIPVVLNEVIVRAFYSVRRFVEQISENNLNTINEIKNVSLENVLPKRGKRLTHMITLSNVTFSTIDLSAACIKAKLKNKDDKTGFALDFVQGINYVGLFRLTVSSSTELGLGIDKALEVSRYLLEKSKEKIIELLPDGEQTLTLIEKAGTTTLAVAKAGTPLGFVSAAIGVYKQISYALEEEKTAYNYRIQIEKVCAERVQMLETYQSEISELVNSYLEAHLELFCEATDMMEKAVKTNDIDLFINGNNIIQNKLGVNAQFASIEEFDELMVATGTLKL